jgi:thiol-disulfide isomerase/thioredoxin
VKVLAAALLAFLIITAAPALAVPRDGSRAPAFTLVDTNGQPVTLAALAGTPIYLNFFATWCGPCRVETPGIVALSRKYRDVRVIGIDVGENAGKARGFVRDFHVPYTLAIDPDATTRGSYGGGLYFPIHVFIDRRGIVRTYHPGEMSAPEIEAALSSVSGR